MTAKEANKLIAEIQRKGAEAQEELRKVQVGIERLRAIGKETFPKKLTKSEGPKLEE
jgi:hypothetical protein